MVSAVGFESGLCDSSTAAEKIIGGSAGCICQMGERYRGVRVAGQNQQAGQRRNPVHWQLNHPIVEVVDS